MKLTDKTPEPSGYVHPQELPSTQLLFESKTNPDLQKHPSVGVTIPQLLFPSGCKHVAGH